MRSKLLVLAGERAVAESLATEFDSSFAVESMSTFAGAHARLARGDIEVVVFGRVGPDSPSEIAARLRSADGVIALVAVAEESEEGSLRAARAGGLIQAYATLPFRAGAVRDLVELVVRAHRADRERAAATGAARLRSRDITSTARLITAAASAKSLHDLGEIASAEINRLIGADATAVVLAEEGGRAAYHVHALASVGAGALAELHDRMRGVVERSRGTGHGLGMTLNEPVVTTDSSSRTFTDEPRIVEAPIIAGASLLGALACRLDARDAAGVAMVPQLAARLGEAMGDVGQRLGDLRRRLSFMVESMADGLILTDQGADQVLINRAARDMMGIPSEAAVTTGFLKDRLGFYPFDLLSARSGDSDAGALREDVRIGDRQLHSIVSPVHDASGRLIGVVIVLRDVTEARALARRQAEFVSTVSHELRTPLTSIAGALDIVLTGFAGRVGDKQERYLKMAREACTRLNLLIDDLLDVARTDAGRLPMQFTPLALDVLGREAAERFRGAAQTKQIQLSVRAASGNIRIVGDSDRLTQVLTNLLSNAIKFTPPRGVIDVEIFGPSVVSDHVGVSVFNNGEAIPEEARERIFDKFEQLDGSSTRRVGGTGLGLAISRAIIEAHGGRIWVDNVERGTKFVFTLPAAPEAEGTEDVEPTTPDASRRALGSEPTATVLIVEDDLHTTYILKGLLMASGHEVLVAEDADTALQLARESRPAIAIVSAALAGIDGLALTAILDHDPETRKTAVLVISADEAQREDALRAGADEFLEKPIHPVRLREACTRLITEAGRAHAPRVLIVDDDDSIRMICREVLEQSGYTVADVDNATDARLLSRRFRPDLVLMDVMMPNVDGFRAAEQLRGEAQTALTPIIFLSAKGETADKVRAFRSGAEDYIVKPFDAAELVARVGKALDRQARELAASPTTQLPGADAIEAEVERRLGGPSNWAICYLDLDNLKAFNDYYGYAKADAVIRQTGDVIRDAVSRFGGETDFIGHIAGDDFVFITTVDHVDAVCHGICAAFDRLIPLYYGKSDRECGFIETKDRYGEERRFPIMSVSIAAVTSACGPLAGVNDLASLAAVGKKTAKAIAGSAYVRDPVTTETALGRSRR